jgi:uncharacterized membrane protein YfcA
MVMDDLNLFSFLIFIAGGFAASVITALAGFAFGIIAAGPWLHVLTPSQTTALIVAYGLLVQGYSVWKLRTAIKIGRLFPFLLGGAIGSALGVQLLSWVSATHLRLGVGAVLIAYGGYGLLRPNLPSFAGASRFIDALVGFFGGVLGGATGLAGIVVMIWSGLRGWSKDEQRAVFQPAGVANFAMIALWIGGVGALDRDTMILFATGLPAILAGLWIGFALYRKTNEAGFRKIVLILLLVSGVTLFF